MLSLHGQGPYAPWVLTATLAFVCLVAISGCKSRTDPIEADRPDPTVAETELGDSAPSGSDGATPEVGGEPQPSPPSPVAFSNEVPSVQELLDVGLNQAQAECFIETLDPDNTGFFTDAERFSVAMSECFGGSSGDS